MLTEQLGSKNPLVRRLVVQQLATRGRDAVPGLCRALNDSDEQVRQGALAAIQRLEVQVSHGGIIRGPVHEKKIALVFTGHEYAEGGEVILTELARHKTKGAFFLTGDFVANSQHEALLKRMVGDGHYVGPHSSKHLLYCAWDNRENTLVSKDKFDSDITANFSEFGRRNIHWPVLGGYFLPPYEHYNHEIALWSLDFFLTVINYTPGTRSNADYTGEADQNFVSSQAIFDSIVKKEREDPHGLNGFILLLHLGSGPGRADKFHTRFGELLDTLAGKGYEFVRVDELLEPKEQP